MIDLHVHTKASDGQYSPKEIINFAYEKQISTIAITDHDTVLGISEAKIESEKYGINLISGIELNINNPTGEFHLLGLGLKNVSSSLQEIIDFVIKKRNLRNELMLKKMQNDGIDISMKELINDFPNTTIGRPHFAAELVKKGIVKKPQQAFDRYIGRGKKWYADRVGTNLDQAISAINESGGIPVIAHPMSLYLSWGKMPETLKKIFEQGVLGMEAFHPGARMTDCLRLEELGRKLGFFITAGSDFHGEKIRADRKLGFTCNGKKIDDKYWTEELKPALKKVNESF